MKENKTATVLLDDLVKVLQQGYTTPKYLIVTPLGGIEVKDNPPTDGKPYIIIHQRNVEIAVIAAASS